MSSFPQQGLERLRRVNTNCFFLKNLKLWWPRGFTRSRESSITSFSITCQTASSHITLAPLPRFGQRTLWTKDHLSQHSGLIEIFPLPRSPEVEDTGLTMKKTHIDPRRITQLVLVISLITVLPATPGHCAAGKEPDYQTATGWWPELNNVWTPIGWKDLAYRFVVLFEGTLVCDPSYDCSIPDMAQYQGQGIQVSFLPVCDENRMKFLDERGPYPTTTETGYRTGHQWWDEQPTPVLVTEWRQRNLEETGLRIQQKVFGYVPEATATKTGMEPLSAWVRLEVAEVHPLFHPKECQILVKVNAPHLIFEMFEGESLQIRPERSRYPRALTQRAQTSGNSATIFFTEEGVKVRLAFPPGEGTVQAMKPPEGSQSVFLVVRFPARTGSHVDLLLPGVPMEYDMAAQLLSEGYDTALARAGKFWSSGIPATKATFDTPEEPLNKTVTGSLRLAELVTAKVPSTGRCSLLTGAIHYNKLWATPTMMVCHMMLDPLGYHSTVEKYLEIFREEQGTVTPPGPAFSPHPGYYSSPKTLTSIDWLSDHGAILHTVCTHALLTGNEKFIEKWLPSILLGCEFIRDSIHLTGHKGVKGIMPPAVPTDDQRLIQAVWTDGWNYKGLATAVRLLERLKHPRAEEFRQVATEYRKVFLDTLRAKTLEMPTWTDPEGKDHHLVPTSLMEKGGDLRHQFYLDTGPLFLAYSGLLDATDELMLSTLRFFREGPNTHFFDPLGQFYQLPVLIHEMSSSECCYSWNIPQAHLAADREKFLEGMYSLFTGSVSRNTFVSCETRGGVTGLVAANPLAVYAARNSVIDDVVEPGSLHLLRLTPKAWLTSDRWAHFENMATEYGPIDLSFRLSGDTKILEVQYESNFRITPRRIVLHIPPADGLEALEVNGKHLPVSSIRNSEVVLPVPE